MESRELTLNEKKVCIAFMIQVLIDRTEHFICHCFSEFVKTETDMVSSELDEPEDSMHIIFPELYNELKSLVVDDINLERYNEHGSRMVGDFEETYKCPVWYSGEYVDRIHFLNDLNVSLK